MLSLIQLIDVHFSNKLLILPYVIFLLLAMRLMIELFKKILKQRNVKVKRVHFIAAIFIVIIVTGIIETTLL